MDKTYNSDFEVRLATLAKLGGDADKNKYDSVYEVDLAILEVIEGGGGGGLTPDEVKAIIEEYNYTTMAEVEQKGYLTEIPSEYVTESDLDAKGYLTEIPSEYVTESDLDAKGYLTEIPAIYAKVVMLTQAEYDALSTKDINTLYIITDAPETSDSADALTASLINEILS